MTPMNQPKRPVSTLLKIAPWALGVAIMLAPLIAMQFTDQVAWTLADFAFLAVMLLGSVAAYSLAVRITPGLSFKAGVGLALLASFALIWINLAVGIIGNEDNPANRIFSSILVVEIAGTLIARFRPRGMAWTMVATATTQLAVSLILFAQGFGATFVLTGIFMIVWLSAAWLFRRAANQALYTQP